MKARAVRLYAANDLRLDTFELPEICDDEILVKVVSDSICMSTYKCAILGTEHKRVHPDVAEHPGSRVCGRYRQGWREASGSVQVGHEVHAAAGAYYEASLAEPISCSIGAFNAAYHTKMGVYHHEMGIKKGGTGFDDVFCYAPVAAVVELCSAVLGRDYAQSVKASGRQKKVL